MYSAEEAARYLDYYVSPDTKAEYAVMLTGPWGVGKTHFIKSYFESRLETPPRRSSLWAWRNKKKLEPQRRYLYASLYGVSSKNEILDQFFVQAHPALSSTHAKIGGAIMARFINFRAGTEVNSEDQNHALLKSIFLNLKDKILIFDDLERSNISISEAMGLINSFVEHDQLKAIIIANEHDIRDDEKKEYKRRKEKLVGKTIEIRSDPSLVLEHQLNSVKPETADIIRLNKAAFLRTFEACSTPSFRIMRAVLHDFDHLIHAVDKRLREAHAAAGKLLNHMLIIELECRGRGIAYEEIARIGTSEYYFEKVTFNDGEGLSNEIRTLSDIESRYDDIDWGNLILPTELIIKFTKSGVLQTTKINEKIAQNPQISGPAGVPVWRRLWYYRNLSEAEYVEARKELLLCLESCSIIEYGEILHTAGLIIKFSEYDDNFIEDRNIVDYFANYIQSIRGVRKINFDPDFAFGDWDSYEDIGFASRDSEDFKKILEIVRNEIKTEALRFFEEKAESIVEALFDDIAKRNLLYESDFSTGKYGHYAFLHLVEPESFARRLIRNAVLDRDMMNCLKRRYESDRGRGRLFDEHDWVERLKLALEAEAASLGSPHRAIVKDLCEHHFEQLERPIREAVSFQKLRSQERTDNGSGSEAIVEAVRSERDSR